MIDAARPAPWWRSSDVVIVALLAAGIGARLAVFAARPSAALWLGDAFVYRDIVAAFLEGRWSSAAWLWTPGYPLAALPLAAVLGPARGLLATSMLLGCLVPVAVFLAAPRSASPAIARIAAVALALTPEAIWASTQPLSDSSGLAFVTLFLIAAVAAAQGDGVPRSIAVGAIGGLAILTRPEVVVLVAAVGLGVRTRRPLAALAALGAVVGPYVVALWFVSGTWGLSLKREYNEYKQHVYAQHGDYYDKRVAWNAEDARLRTPDGGWDPRKIAALEVPGATLASVLRGAARRALLGARNMDPVSALLFVVGLVGLAWPGSSARGTRAARWSLLGYAPLPFIVTPLARFVLPLVPAVAWGWGTLVELLVRRVGRWTGGALALVACAACFTGVAPRVNDSDFDVYRVEVLVLVREGRLSEAEAMMRAWIRESPDHAEAHSQLAAILGGQGRWDDAIRSFERALALGASRDVISYNIGVTHLRAGRPEEARPWLEEATRTEDPERRERASRLLEEWTGDRAGNAGGSR